MFRLFAVFLFVLHFFVNDNSVRISRWIVLESERDTLLSYVVCVAINRIINEATVRNRLDVCESCVDKRFGLFVGHIASFAIEIDWQFGISCELSQWDWPFCTLFLIQSKIAFNTYLQCCQKLLKAEQTGSSWVLSQQQQQLTGLILTIRCLFCDDKMKLLFFFSFCRHMYCTVLFGHTWQWLISIMRLEMRSISDFENKQNITNCKQNESAVGRTIHSMNTVQCFRCYRNIWTLSRSEKNMFEKKNSNVSNEMKWNGTENCI